MRNSGTLRFAGRLLAPPSFPSHSPGGGIVVLLYAKDFYVCEDLGRQLRELAGRVGSAKRLTVWTQPEDVAEIRA